jgi:hypothetical protein
MIENRSFRLLLQALSGGVRPQGRGSLWTIKGASKKCRSPVVVPSETDCSRRLGRACLPAYGDFSRCSQKNFVYLWNNPVHFGTKCVGVLAIKYE